MQLEQSVGSNSEDLSKEEDDKSEDGSYDQKLDSNEKKINKSSPQKAKQQAIIQIKQPEKRTFKTDSHSRHGSLGRAPTTLGEGGLCALLDMLEGSVEEEGEDGGRRLNNTDTWYRDSLPSSSLKKQIFKFVYLNFIIKFKKNAILKLLKFSN